MTLSATDKNNCIIQTTNINNVFEYSYNLSEIMKSASRLYKFERRFNKSLEFGEVLKAVWNQVRQLMNHYRTAASNLTLPKQIIKISGGDFNSDYNVFGNRYKLVN